MTERKRADRLLLGYIAVLAAAAAALTIQLARTDADVPGQHTWWTLSVLGPLIVAGEYLFVRFRFRGEINALNLLEAIIAPLIFAFPPAIAVGTVAVAETVGGILRRNQPVKAAFNVAQWSLATAAGVTVLSLMAPGSGVSWASMGATLVALSVIGIVNQAAFSTVIAIAERRSIPHVLRGLGPIMFVGWGVGWALNAAVGLLFVLAYAGHPGSVVLYVVPLVVLHLAYRGYAGARSDRMRLAGLHRAAGLLAEPLDPADAIMPFLREVVEVFEASGASLVLIEDDGLAVHQVSLRGGRTERTVRYEPLDGSSLEHDVLADGSSARIVGGKHGSPRWAKLADSGWRDCLVAPLLDDGVPVGVLLVFDQTGLEGFDAGELAVLEALARETASTLAKGRMLQRILEERRRLSEIVTTTSDGIVSIAVDGTIESWNPAMERITGIHAEEILGRNDRITLLTLSTTEGEAVALDRWASGVHLPTDLLAIDVHGRRHRLSCSYNRAIDTDGTTGALVVIARDVSSQDELEELRLEAGRLARAAAAQRAIVEQIQQALMPAQLVVPGLEVGVRYVASDPAVPTGGDLYDWVLLDSGEVQLAVVDVLGHGVGATKHALTVVHTLRLLAAQGCPIEELVERAHRILTVQDPGLVSTVIVARYEPESGRVRIAAGGHPPALLASPSGGVRQIAAPGGPIGWPGGGSIATAELVLTPGEALILYTDGLIEASKDILAGEEALIRHARMLIDESAQEMANQLVERALAEGSRRDDSVAVVIRRAPRRASWRVSSVPGSVREVRRELRAWLVVQGLDHEAIERAALVSSELLTNAVRAARTEVGLTASIVDQAAITLEVDDDGVGDEMIAGRGIGAPSLTQEDGRGLFVVRTLCDDLSFVSTTEGTIVRCVLPVGVGQEVRVPTDSV